MIVVVHDMAREAPRTLFSLSATYQREIAAHEYEIIVVDNGSTPPVSPEIISGLAGNFRLIRIEPAPPSPARAINEGIAASRGDLVGVFIDGARIASPGLIHHAALAAGLHRRPVIATPGFSLGSDIQIRTIAEGYDQAVEDRLLESVHWKEDGYRLFRISAFDNSPTPGWFMPIEESNALFMPRELWTELGGYDQRFDSPGGGLVNLDTYERACGLPGAQVVVLLGEATFHQVHGGIATNAIASPVAAFLKEYAFIRGKSFQRPRPQPLYLGRLHPDALARLAPSSPTPGTKRSLESALRARAKAWGGTGALARRDGGRLHKGRRWARAAWRATNAAAAEYRAALDLDEEQGRAQLKLANLRMPGPDHVAWLEWLQRTLAPETYLEIGVDRGHSLALAQPPTLVIGVDPGIGLDPLSLPLVAETHLFAETSDDFFGGQRLRTLLQNRPVGLAYIDGLHTFDQALRDFINVEAHCGQRSIVAFHDTVPLDESTQLRERTTRFWTGDVWKAIVCLRQYRPELDVLTIAAPPTGLTLVMGLAPTSRVLPAVLDEAVERFMRVPFGTIADRLESALNIVPNDWQLVRSRLTANGLVDEPKVVSVDIEPAAQPDDERVIG